MKYAAVLIGEPIEGIEKIKERCNKFSLQFVSCFRNWSLSRTQKVYSEQKNSQKLKSKMIVELLLIVKSYAKKYAGNCD